MYYPNANRVQQFQANFLRKMAAAGSPTAQKAQNQQGQQMSEADLANLTNLGYGMEDAVQQTLWNQKLENDPEMRARYNAFRRERMKQLLKAYAPYVGGGAALGALLGGGIGYRSGNTLAGGLLGLGGGALLGAAGKYAYDKYQKSKAPAPTGPVAVG